MYQTRIAQPCEFIVIHYINIVENGCFEYRGVLGVHWGCTRKKAPNPLGENGFDVSNFQKYTSTRQNVYPPIDVNMAAKQRKLEIRFFLHY